MLRLFLLLTAAFVLCFSNRPAAAAPLGSDTLRLTLPEAEQRFLAGNLQLLAQRYNIAAAEAQIQQARLWDNPTISIEQNAYNQYTHRVLDVTRQGNSIVQVQQLLALAGRRRAAADVARQSTLVEQFTFDDLLRNLRYQLRSTFYDLYFKQQSVGVYDMEVASFQRTVNLYQGQYEKGNIALKEVIRLKAFLFQLRNERQALLSEIAAQQADLRILLRDEAGTYYLPQADDARLRALTLAGRSEQQLIDSAQVARADVRARQAAVQQQTQNLRYQRALATPDLAVGYVYDRAGNYIQNYHALSLGVAVPLFNRNQGNIRTARNQIDISRAQLSQQQLQAENDVQEAWRLARQTDQLYQSAGRDTGDFDRLMVGIDQSYAKRNLTIVEYLDFYESYKNNLVQLNNLRASRVRAFEQLNFAVGRPVFN
ncbi:TolC family protein [Hymenobacter actinosclerus]|uniref:Outer membrane protein, cobalt-zinc-cadmium efflux system n=1 Tax=Hymenobacter actinosclerus TaxID=82805 RepID=A0A1I0C2S6_9BACT|nr:TolC family protein [Hymenobacter actinosclerus]SET13729.1 outer membrane protein, cobalt-zinc-cadmium efflux system [Hymenobacter actinosclerus]